MFTRWLTIPTVGPLAHFNRPLLNVHNHKDLCVPGPLQDLHGRVGDGLDLRPRDVPLPVKPLPPPALAPPHTAAAHGLVYQEQVQLLLLRRRVTREERQVGGIPCPCRRLSPLCGDAKPLPVQRRDPQLLAHKEVGAESKEQLVQEVEEEGGQVVPLRLVRPARTVCQVMRCYLGVGSEGCGALQLLFASSPSSTAGARPWLPRGGPT